MHFGFSEAIHLLPLAFLDCLLSATPSLAIVVSSLLSILLLIYNHISASSNSEKILSPNQLSVAMPVCVEGKTMTIEDDSFPRVEEIDPRSDKARSDFLKLHVDDHVPVKSEIGAARLSKLKAKYDIPAHIDLVPTGDDVI